MPGGELRCILNLRERVHILYVQHGLPPRLTFKVLGQVGEPALLVLLVRQFSIAEKQLFGCCRTGAYLQSIG